VKLSVLDQSPVISGLGARRAIEETLALARRVEELGYHRYWLAEHHAIAALADPCPEVLLARLGAETRRLRIGTGGVLLPYYSAFRTAETFRMLEALYPGRIDLGVGRELRRRADPTNHPWKSVPQARQATVWPRQHISGTRIAHSGRPKEPCA